MRRLINALLAAVAVAAFCSSADAATSKYYSRQHLSNLSTANPTPSYTYTAAYGAFSACSHATQSATITSCTRSDGQSADLSLCSPQTKSQSCVTACGVPAATYWVASATAVYSGNAVTASDAQTFCNARITAKGNYSCALDTRINTVYVFNTASLEGGHSSFLLASSCN